MLSDGNKVSSSGAWKIGCMLILCYKICHLCFKKFDFSCVRIEPTLDDLRPTWGMALLLSYSSL